MPLNYEYSFEVRPGKPVFIQRKDSLEQGKRLTAVVEEEYQPCDLFFHFRKRGGHVAAMKRHLGNAYFSRFDLEDFFGHVTRTKIVRALRNLGWSHKEAFSDAVDSVVVLNGQRVLPFGFHQSPLIATLVLEQSFLGQLLQRQADDGFTVSIYMDDILISGNDQTLLADRSAELVEVAASAGFPVSAQKQAVALEEASIFNCVLNQDSVRFLDHRMRKFLIDHEVTSDLGKQAIEAYIRAVSHEEHEAFLAQLDQPDDVAGLGVNVRLFP